MEPKVNNFLSNIGVDKIMKMGTSESGTSLEGDITSTNYEVIQIVWFEISSWKIFNVKQ